MEESNITVVKENGIATIRINRPKFLNALNSTISKEILNELEKIKLDSSIRVLIVTGTGRSFVAGADVKEMSDFPPRKAREFCTVAIDINNELESMPIPTIAAINGLALGGGLELALACDFRVGGSRTLLALPEVGLGIIPGAHGCARITSIIGPSKAKQLIMLNEKIPGKLAYEIGLINWYVTGNATLDEEVTSAQTSLIAQKSCEENKVLLKQAEDRARSAEKVADAAEAEAIYTKAMDIAQLLKSKPKCALAAAKAVINTAANESIRAGKTAETAEFSLLFDTDDQKEGMSAMLEKRVAVFTNN